MFGVAFGNLLQGVPFRIDSDMRVLYEGSGLFELLNPFGLLCGLVSAGDADDARRGLSDGARRTAPVQAAARGLRTHRRAGHGRAVPVAGLWDAFGLNGYAITSAIVADGPSNPLLKTVARKCPAIGSPITAPTSG